MSNKALEALRNYKPSKEAGDEMRKALNERGKEFEKQNREDRKTHQWWDKANWI